MKCATVIWRAPPAGVASERVPEESGFAETGPQDESDFADCTTRSGAPPEMTDIPRSVTGMRQARLIGRPLSIV